MNAKRLFFFIITAVVLLSACIKNDVPFPHIQANILTLNIKGQDKGTVIDSVNLTATVHFPEEIDITAVRVTGYTLTPGSTVVDNTLSGDIDLSKPYSVILRMYQDYMWKIIGTQDIERYFRVEGQIGNTVIDVPAHRIVVYMPETAETSKLKIISAKLANTGSVINPDIADGGTVDASAPVELSVTVFGRTETWTLYVERLAVTVRTLGVDAWTAVAWVHGQGEAGKPYGVQYRLAGTEEWTEVPQTDISGDGAAFTAKICHLDPLTSYQARVYSEEIYGDIEIGRAHV